MSKSALIFPTLALVMTGGFSLGPAGALVPSLVVAQDVDGDGFAAGDCAPSNPAVNPGAADRPDLAFADTNCDGIDGDETDAVFVTVSGSDAATGTKNNPKQTIAGALAIAGPTGRDVYVAGGEYVGSLNLIDDVGIYGGYTPITWARSAAETTTLKGGPAALAVGDTGVILQQLTLQAQPDGSGNVYGLRAVSDGTTASQVVLERVTAFAANAAAGSTGSTGSNGGFAVGSFGGNGGTGSCVPGVPGGFGTGGGPMGSGGLNASNQTFTLSDATAWLRNFASNGGTGGAGSGGQGGRGGAATAGLFGIVACGGAGGQGGRGGGPGFGGGGGQAGGGSFGAYLFNSSLVARSSSLTASNGGTGGNGGSGGSGGLGGAGFPGVLGTCVPGACGFTGDAGFVGQPGGAGGGGGGGVGGPSAGIYQAGGLSGYTDRASTETAGTPGLGGFRGNGGARAASGQSAPVLRTGTAPATSTYDFDGDGINDTADSCPADHRGTADRNGDGCAEPPQTSITAGPATNSFLLSNQAALRFASNEAGSTFSCSLDNGTGAGCTSPRTLSGLSARTHTFKVWARDAAGDADPTAGSRVFTVPRNNTGLAHSAGWAKRTGTGYFLNTFSTTTRKAAALSTKVSGARRIALVATRGPGHGKVNVLLGTTLLRQVALSSSTLRKKQLIPITTFASGRSGTLRVVVATSGKTVRIEGLGVATQ